MEAGAGVAASSASSASSTSSTSAAEGKGGGPSETDQERLARRMRDEERAMQQQEAAQRRAEGAAAEGKGGPSETDQERLARRMRDEERAMQQQEAAQRRAEGAAAEGKGGPSETDQERLARRMRDEERAMQQQEAAQRRAEGAAAGGKGGPSETDQERLERAMQQQAEAEGKSGTDLHPAAEGKTHADKADGKTPDQAEDEIRLLRAALEERARLQAELARRDAAVAPGRDDDDGDNGPVAAGHAAMRAHRFQDAIEAYSQAPPTAAVLYCRASARLRLGDARGAICDADAALAARPGWDKALVCRGSALAALGDVDAALDAFVAAGSLRAVRDLADPRRDGLCEHCLAAAAPMRCAQCGAVAYCDAECQQAHWTAMHAAECGSVTLAADEPAERSAAEDPLRRVALCRRALRHEELERGSEVWALLQLECGAAMRELGHARARVHLEAARTGALRATRPAAWERLLGLLGG